jgi:NTE family protein
VSKSIKLNLALQGGGSHGAYTWGVLDRLLEEEDIEIEAISGTSAGAMNAAVLANGYMQNGRAGAKNLLETFWYEVSLLGLVSPFQQTPFEQYGNSWNLDWSLSYSYFDLISRLISPYQLNPLNLNPLRWVLDKVLDKSLLNACSSMKLFISATQVRSGQPRIFECGEITTDVLLASTCIPQIFQAVEIDGEPYWDGGFMGNPVIWPLVYRTNISDVLLVQINPIFRDGTPKHASDIINRLNEITFNSSLIGEMRAINFVSKLIRENRLDSNKYKDVRMHMIAADPEVHGLNASSKLNTSWAFFQYLCSMGRDRAEVWIRENKHHIGKKSSVDIREIFLGGVKSTSPQQKKNPKTEAA